MEPASIADGHPTDGFDSLMRHPEPEGPGGFEIGWWPTADKTRSEASQHATTDAKSWRLTAVPPIRDSTPPSDALAVTVPTSFHPTTQDDLAPPGATAKVTANVAALRLLRELQAADRPATVDEQQVLARWSGWGAVPAVFDERSERFADARSELKQLLDEREWRAASKTTLNAHYTDAAIARAMWDVVTEAGFGADREPVRVLEPGCGAGTFIGLAPAAVTAKDSALFGVELDPTTAAIAQRLYPHADIRQESFADTRLPRSYLDLVIGNVPFGKIQLHDPVHNAGNYSLHNHFIIKSLALTRPGGVVTVLTSHYTMDAANPAARGDRMVA
jgi:hypothetical protein